MSLPDLSFSTSRRSITTHSILTQRVPKSRHREDDSVEDGTEYSERTLDKLARLVALAKEYDEVDCYDGVMASECCAIT
jgi:hypothetical protein